MTLLDPTTLPSELTDALRSKVQSAPVPLKLTEIVKGLPKPRKTKSADFQNEIRPILDEQVRLGQVFRYPSGKNGEMRYWSRDEKHLLRERAIELASTPQTFAAMKTKLKSVVKGVEAGFVQSVLHELIGENKLFEHPAKTARGGSLLGATPPPPPLPPLAQPKHAKALNKLVADCRKLLAASQVSAEELLQAIQSQLQGTAAEGVKPIIPQPATMEPPQTAESARSQLIPEPTPPSLPELDELILKALGHAPVLSLADLRSGMPTEYRGTAFDAAVLRLADEQQVILSQDALAERFSDAEKAEYVRDGEALFTTIAKWS